MATTCKQITATLRKEGLPLELVKADGYFYFIYDTLDDKNSKILAWETKSVYVSSLSQLSTDAWVKEGREFAEEVELKWA